MSLRYWCQRCTKYIVPIIRQFKHPHIEGTTAFCCPDCGLTVALKDDGLEPTAGEKIA